MRSSQQSGVEMGKPIRLRDFIEDKDGWLYAVSSYDTREAIGATLRYIPDVKGERCDRSGRRYRKLEFDESYRIISQQKPEYLDTLHRVPVSDIVQVYKPEEEMPSILRRDVRVCTLSNSLGLVEGTAGCTGSLLCGLECGESDIDLVVYGDAWFRERQNLIAGILGGKLEGLSEDMWRRVYEKRRPSIGYEEFLLHEKRKWNRGQISGTYFDLLYTREYGDLETARFSKGKVVGRQTITALVKDSKYAFDSPAVYRVVHEEISAVLSFTHTYSGQAFPGEIIEASGVCEVHGDERWLIVGTSREAPGEYIRSKTLLEQAA